MFINSEAAQKRAEAAKKRAEAAKKQGRAAAKKKAIWMIVVFFFEVVRPQNRLLSGSSLYFTLSCIGAIYSWSLYRQFDIPILNYS